MSALTRRLRARFIVVLPHERVAGSGMLSECVAQGVCIPACPRGSTSGCRMGSKLVICIYKSGLFRLYWPKRGSRRVSAGRCAGEGEGWPVAHREEEAGRRSVRKAVTAAPGDSRRLFSLRLKASEYERLRFLARSKGVSMARYLTAQGLTPPVEQVNPEQLRELLGLLRVLCRQVQGEATNINQIAHWANASRRFPAEAEQVVRELRRQVDALCEVRAKVSDLL